MKTILMLFVCFFLFQISNAQSANQRIFFGPVKAAIGPGGSSKPIASFCFDFGRDAPTSYTGYSNVHHDGESVVRIGNKPPISLQDALRGGFIEMEGDGYESFTFKNNTKEDVDIETKENSVAGDEDNDLEDLFPDIINLKTDNLDQKTLWNSIELKKKKFPVAEADLINLAKQLSLIEAYPSNWIVLNDGNPAFLHWSVEGNFDVMVYDRAAKKLSSKYKFDYPEIDANFVDKFTSDVFIVNDRLVKIGDLREAVGKLDPMTFVFGSNMKVTDIQSMVRNHQIREISSNGISALSFTKVSGITHDFSVNPTFSVEDYNFSGTLKSVSFPVKRSASVPSGNGLVGPIDITIAKVPEEQVNPVEAVVNTTFGKMRDNSSINFATQLLMDLKARQIDPKQLYATMRGIEVTLHYPDRKEYFVIESKAEYGD